jgi:hypothetical protein
LTEANGCIFYSLLQFRRFDFLSYKKIGFNARCQHIRKVEGKCYFEFIFCIYISRSCWWGYCWNSCWNSGCSVIGSWYVFWILPEEEDTEGGTFFARFHCTLFSRWKGYGYFYLYSFQNLPSPTFTGVSSFLIPFKVFLIVYYHFQPLFSLKPLGFSPRMIKSYMVIYVRVWIHGENVIMDFSSCYVKHSFSKNLDVHSL